MNDPIGTGSSDRPENIKINVTFPVQGQRLPADHGYLLYSAITKKLEEIEEDRRKKGPSKGQPLSHNLPDNERWLGIELISGVPFDKGLIVLPTRNARLNLRIPADKFGEVIPLAGKSLDINSHQIRLGIPTAKPLQPASALYSRIVTFRNSMEIPKFLETAKKEFAEKDINATLELPKEDRSRQRRIITIKGKKIVGFSLVARDLSDEDSIKLQSLGLGGRRAMGCGIFNPVRKPYDFEENGDE